MQQRFALYGKPGAGKSTFTRNLVEEFEERAIPTLTVKIAAPLYELQAVIYAMAGRPMLDSGRQDGKLLADLGSHLRRINSEALTTAFTARIRQAEQCFPDAVLLCDDLRASDLAAVTELGFATVRISACEKIRQTRKAERGDLSPGDDAHSAEASIMEEPWYQVINDGTREELRNHAAFLVEEVLR